MPLIWKEEEEAEIIKVLQDGGACPKCCQRFLGYKQSLLYIRMHQEESGQRDGEDSGDGTEEPAAKSWKPNPCVVCLGILQDHYMVPRMEEVIKQIQESGYDAERFTLSLSLPICLSIRQHALWLHLAKEKSELLKERGHEQEDVVPVKQVWKYIYPDLVTDKVGLTHENGDSADFFVELQIIWKNDDEEMKVMEKVCPKEYKDRAHKRNVYNMGVYSRQGVEKSLENVGYNAFCVHSPVPPSIPDAPFSLDFKMSRNSVYVGGRYCKYSRHLPQTPWLINGVRKCVTSVEEIIGERLCQYLKAEQVKFLASGREDVDVRMLGTGRPFAFECLNSKKSRFTAEELQELEAFINSHHPSVQVNSMDLVTKKCIKRLKEGEDSKRKRYTALCTSNTEQCDPEKLRTLDSMVDMVIKQETPIRVLHRRSNAVREKVIHSMAVEPISDGQFKLAVTSSAGAYIKELVHGDFGRTVPSLRNLLGMETDILALDVEEVYLPWPKQQQPESNGVHIKS